MEMIDHHRATEAWSDDRLRSKGLPTVRPVSQRRYVLLDRDGTIIVERHYLADAASVELLPHSAAGLRRLSELGYGLVVATNQSGIARGKITPSQVSDVHCRLIDLLTAKGIGLAGIYLCPHGPDDDCHCRKPRIGLATAAQRELAFRMEECVVIGDKRSEVLLGQAIGARTVLVRTGYGRATESENHTVPDYVADDLLDAAERIEKCRPTSSIN